MIDENAVVDKQRGRHARELWAARQRQRENQPSEDSIPPRLGWFLGDGAV
jgi:hypothetical protein